MKQRIANLILLIAFFLLPWQTVFLYRIITLPEGASVYGNMGVYATELLIVLAFLLRGWPIISAHAQKVVRALYVFLAASFLSLTWSFAYPVSLGFMSHAMVANMLFLLLIDNRTNITLMIKSFLAGLILPCLLGWYQYVFGWSPALTFLGLAEKRVETSGIAVVATDTFRSLRAYGSFPHPNIFGGFLAVGVLLIGWMVRHTKTKKQAHLYTPLIVLLTSTLILTFSRGAWLALTVSLVLILAQAFWYKKLIPHRAIPLLTVGMVTILLSVGILHTSIFARFNPALRVEAISIEERSSQYRTFPSVFMMNPLTGVGPGAYVFALESISKGQPAWSYQPMHNFFLLLLAELGLIGFGAFGYLVFEIVRVVFVHRKTTGGIFAASFLVALLFLGGFDHYLFSLWPGLALLVFLFAFCLRIAEQETKTA